MGYGHFSKDAREYIITRPDTPRPWFNYLFNSVYHALVSQTGGGFSYYKDPKFYRILRYDHISTDRPGRYIYLIDLDTKRVWSANWQPQMEKMDFWQCRHGLGYTKIESEKFGIRVSITYFVTQKDPLEIWLVKLQNVSNKKRNLKIFPFAELVCGDIALEIHYRNILCLYNEAYFDKDLNAIIAFKHPFRQNQHTAYGFFTKSGQIDSFDCQREEFFGRYSDGNLPIALKEGKCKKSFARGDDMVAVLEADEHFKPKEEKEFVVILGMHEDKKTIGKLIEKYTNTENAKKELEIVKKFWANMVDKLYVKTPDSNFNLMVNIWGKYQLCAITHWRGTSQFHGAEGGLGYRDTAQDSEGLLSIDPELAKEKLEKILYYQYNSGHAVSGFSDIEGTWEKSGQDMVTKKADVSVWLVYAVISYLKETGDFDFLKQKRKFHDGGEATVLEHVVKAVDFIYSQRGSHGLPLIGKADWNDAYDAVGIKGKGESVWLGMALCRAYRQIEELAEVLGDSALKEKMGNRFKEMKKIINDIGWDGDWYLAAFNDAGLKIGSAENKEGKVPLNSQTWAILSDVVSDNRLEKILEKVDNYLDTKFGPALFLPSYTKFNPGIGRVTAFAEGTKENAAIFSHACAFKIVADCYIKRGDKAYETFSKLHPMSPAKKDIEKYKVEPYVWAEYVIGPGSKHRFGEGAFTWNTGTSAWMFTAASEWILGARREFKGLLIDPCIPADWKECFIRRPFRGAVYEIIIKNPKNKECGVKEIFVDGKKQKGNLIEPHSDGKTYKVEVILG